MLRLPLLSESSWEKPADFPSDVASGSEPTKEEETPEEPATPQPESLSGGEESSNGAPPSQEAEPPEEAGQQPKIPKISFRVRVNETYVSACQDSVEKFQLSQFCSCFQKRKAEDEPLEKEEEDKASDDAPKDDGEETKKDEAVQSVTAEPEEEKKEAPQSVTQAKRTKAANPYGTWEKIQEEEDP